MNPNDLKSFCCITFSHHYYWLWNLSTKLQVCISDYTLTIGYLVIFFILQVYSRGFFSQFSCLVVSVCLWPCGLQHTRLLCPLPAPRTYSNSCPLSEWCQPTISSSVLPSPPTFNLAKHQGLFKWVSSSHQVVKVLEFQLQHQFFQWIFRTDFL